MEKVKLFHERFEIGKFIAICGWLDKLKKRHGILSGEKLSNDEEIHGHN